MPATPTNVIPLRGNRDSAAPRLAIGEPSRHRPDVTSPLRLPCGTELPNRIAKASQPEGLADRAGRVTPELRELYRSLAHSSGAGLLITGDVMVDRSARIASGVVVADDRDILPGLVGWADAAHATGTPIWMQINHPGRLARLPVHRRPVGPIAGHPFELRGPRRLSTGQIDGLVAAFAHTAQLAVSAGFDGVHIHAAHGYLLSQFLSPLTNSRTDCYGGDAAGRRQLLLDVVAAVRGVVGAHVPIGVKLNAADFQRGGLEPGESTEAARALADAGVDLLEITGGSHAVPATARALSRGHTDAYLVRHARHLRDADLGVALMLAGAMNDDAARDAAFDAGIDLIGVARPMGADVRGRVGSTTRAALRVVGRVAGR